MLAYVKLTGRQIVEEDSAAINIYSDRIPRKIVKLIWKPHIIFNQIYSQAHVMKMITQIYI